MGYCSNCECKDCEFARQELNEKFGPLTSFELKLAKNGDYILAIKEVRARTGLNLANAKKLVDLHV